MKDRIQNTERRGFLRQFFVQAHHLIEEAQGHPQRSLLGLKALSDDALARIVPVWRAGYAVIAGPNGLQASANILDAPQTAPLSESERIAMEVFATGRTLDGIARWLSQRTRQDRDSAFRCTRDLFLRLCDLGWSHPGNDFEGNEP